MSNTISTSDEFSHTTVLLPETVAMVLGVKQLNDVTSKVSGVYVDATFGRGGHSRLLLEYLAPEATLVVFDKDPEAIAVAKSLAAQDERIKVVHDSFAHLTKNLQALGIDKIDGLMADLGVSSPQLDDGTRGFSFMRDGVVDMRMDTTRGEPVSEWLQRVSADELADVLYEYGEERHSRKIARAIKSMPNYTSTRQLAEVIKQAHPAWQRGKHPATQSFQAMRIFINNELGDVEAFLAQSIGVLKAGGMLAVISFHSLEDRLIKQFLQRHSRGQYEEDTHLPIIPKRPKYFGKPKRVGPSDQEVKANPRARSAWLRGGVRLDTILVAQDED
ncbi:16S rRNA (cytosine(1402)-N(4))-methyltransferase RsmH [Moraxella catarrhalis]|uniref:16S rRNA (cytosine(1402)-N(4))-methyltransferase RsmH n=1 Tax=Moraxella catarrhalis TaxID=480 RepID=UPI0007E43816|nr:16S rRNA (cytosine(1402)-N(4))-methyltransferase RsmH [Moraxella catarrhalis]